MILLDRRLFFKRTDKHVPKYLARATLNNKKATMFYIKHLINITNNKTYF